MIRTKSEFELGFEHCDLKSNKPLQNMRYLLYLGGAESNQCSVERKIAAGGLGEARLGRQQLVSMFHCYFEGQFKLNARRTIYNYVRALRALYAEYDRLGVDLSLENIVECYESYSRMRWEQVLRGSFHGSADNAYTLDLDMQKAIKGALELHPGSLKSAFEYPELRRRGLLRKPKVDKSSLSEGFQFGADMMDIIDALSVTACFGELPIAIKFSDGSTYDYWGGLYTPEQHLIRSKTRVATKCPRAKKRTEKATEKRRVSGDAKTRALVVSMRVHAEFNFFLSQTGLNVSVAYNLPYEDYRCTTIEGGCRIVAYKPRKQSDVEIFVYAEYKNHFLNYLRFLKEVYPDGCEYLFPLQTKGAKRVEEYVQVTFAKFMKRAGRVCLTADSLRKKRVNWLLRETHNPSFVASDAQHTKRTLLEQYSAPSQEIAFSEWADFFSKRKLSRDAVLEGQCIPVSAVPIASDVVTPDCMNPTGCLFCIYYQGVKTLDYIWSLATFRFLKYSEFMLIPINRDLAGSPQKAVVDRIDLIMDAFSRQDDACWEWKKEAELRILERNFHPNYRGLIEVRFNE